MQLTSLPADYKSAYGRLNYSFAGDNNDSTVDIEIYCHNRLSGVKRVRNGSTFTIDAADYVTHFFNPQPAIVYRNATAVNINTYANADVEVGVGDIRSEMRMFTVATEDLELYQIASPMGSERTICPGEMDEISFVSPEASVGARVTIYNPAATTYSINQLSCPKGLRTVAIGMNDVVTHVLTNPELIEKLKVEILIDNTVRATVNYRVRERKADSARLCWLNRLGGISYYTFDYKTSEWVESQKERIETESGSRTVWSESRICCSLMSDYLTDAQAESISDLIASPRVWRLNDEGSVATPVDVVTAKVTTHTNSLKAVRVTVRNAATLKHQTL